MSHITESALLGAWHGRVPTRLVTVAHQLCTSAAHINIIAIYHINWSLSTAIGTCGCPEKKEERAVVKAPLTLKVKQFAT